MLSTVLNPLYALDHLFSYSHFTDDETMAETGKKTHKCTNHFITFPM